MTFKGDSKNKKTKSVQDPDIGPLADLARSSEIINQCFVNIGRNLNDKLLFVSDTGTMDSVIC